MSTNTERPGRRPSASPAPGLPDHDGSPRSPDLFSTLAAFALQGIAGAEHAIVSVRDGDGALTTLASSSTVASALDRLQQGLREGPCFSTSSEETSLICHDLEFDTRWPEFGPRAIARGVRSVACHLVGEWREPTYLTVYSSSVGQFLDGDGPAMLVVALAASTLELGREADNLRRALATRTTIGQATGILVERLGLDTDRAFEHLVRLSQTSNTKLARVAESIVRETELRS